MIHNNKLYLNLEDQVEKNRSDIEYILNEEGTLNQFGLKVVGLETSASELPDPTEYEGDYGDAYLIGTEAPWDMYVFTRAFGSYSTDHWFNIGQFPKPGPAGPTGPRGADGARGPAGTQWFSG